MIKLSKYFVLVVFLAGARSVFAQDIEAKATLHAFADNREYGNSNRFSQTIFGTRFSPEIGLRIDTNHRLRLGLNALHEFGSPKFTNKIDPVAYYQFANADWDFYIGAFPRHNLLTDYPRAILKDTLVYYRPNVEGMLLQRKLKNGHQTLWIDWTSRQTDIDRETFLFGLSGYYETGLFFFSHYAMMFHNAGPAIDIPGDHIQDNGAAAVKVGMDLSGRSFLDSLTLNTGGLISFERVRNVQNWKTPKGIMLEMHAGYKRFALTNSLYLGEGHQVVYGDQFYTAKKYNRTDLSFTPIRHKNIEGVFTLSLHFLEGKIDNQQAFSLRYSIGKQVAKL